MKSFKILYHKRPSNLIKTNAKEKIRELYENEELSTTSKKQIINILLGLLEKKKNTRSKVQLFTTQEEAQYYIEKCGGVLGELSFYEDLEYNDNCLFMEGNKEEKTIYTVKHEVEKQLLSGFLPVKEMIYDIQRRKLYQLYRKCKKNDIEVYGIKTDCVLVDRDDLLAVENVFSKQMSKEVGGLKVEFDKHTFGDPLKLKENKFIRPYRPTANEIEVKDEYDKEELGEINVEHNKILYLASDAGCGKSTA